MNRLTRPRSSIAALMFGATLVLASCASGGGGEAASDAASGAAGDATAPESAPVATAEASDAAAGGGEDYAAMLTAATELAPGDSWAGPTEPAPAPEGLKIAAITCYSILEGCVIPAEGIAKAADAIGWESQIFDGGGTPASQNEQILNAVSYGADVIALIAISPATVQSGLEAAERAGIVVVSGSSGISEPNDTLEPPAGAVWPSVDVSPDYEQLAMNIGNWVIADSGGTANVAVYGDKEFDSINAQERGIVPALAACTGCTVSDVMYFTASQIGSTLGPQVVSYLRANPDVNYVYMPYDPPAVAVVTAIANAGMADRVKVVSALGNSQNLNFVADGNVQFADAAYDNIYMGFAMVDQAIRVLNDQPLSQPLGENLPYQLLTADNLPDDLDSWNAPFPYEEEFLALWQ